MGVASKLRAVLWACAACLAVSASAGAPKPDPGRDKAWDALIAEAKAHGGVETKLDKSASYVFLRPDGSVVTLTRLLKSKAGRSVCVLARDQNSTACVDWDTGKLTLGSRADAATPWTFSSFESLDAFDKAQPGLADRLFSAIEDMFGNVEFLGGWGGGYGGGWGGGYGGGYGVRRH